MKNKKNIIETSRMRREKAFKELVIDYNISKKSDIFKILKTHLTEVRQHPVTGKKQRKQLGKPKQRGYYETPVREIRIGDGIVYSIPLLIEVRM